MKVIYIASPYTIGNTAVNLSRSFDAAHALLDVGFSPIAPLLNHFLDIHKPRVELDWIDADLALVKKCDAVWRLTGESKGADGEVDLATELNIPVFISIYSIIRHFNQ